MIYSMPSSGLSFWYTPYNHIIILDVFLCFKGVIKYEVCLNSARCFPICNYVRLVEKLRNETQNNALILKNDVCLFNDFEHFKVGQM